MYPTYKELLKRSDGPPGTSWGLFNDDRGRGTLNFITPSNIVDACRLVTSGRSFSLDLTVGQIDPPMLGRKATAHTVIDMFDAGFVFDDYLDAFYLQGSSQWDALRHMRDPALGFYGGAADDDVHAGTHLGIDRYAEGGVIARGVLLDLERFFAAAGRPIDPQSDTLVGPSDLEACARQEGVELKRGDVLVLRTGWLAWYLNEASAEERAALGENAGAVPSPGVGPGDAIAEFLWDNRIAAIATDNIAVEPLPVVEPGLHMIALAHLGIPLGELWFLEELAADCAGDGRHDFLLTSAPLNVRGGVGSPPNALAIK